MSVVYANVTTLRSGLCYRKSVCRLLSSCLSVTLVHPTQGVEDFRQYLFTAVYAGHPLTSVQNFRRSSQVNPSVVSVKRNRVSKIERRWTCRRLQSYRCHVQVYIISVLMRFFVRDNKLTTVGYVARLTQSFRSCPRLVARHFVTRQQLFRVTLIRKR